MGRVEGLKRSTQRVGVGKEGAETTLVGNDLMRSVEFLKFFPMFVTSAVSLVCGVVLLLVFLGWVALVGLGTMALVLTCTVSLSRLAKRYQQRALAAADKTVNALREGVEGVRLVKMQSWEEAFCEHIARFRADELSQLRRFRVLTIFTICMGRGSPVLASNILSVPLEAGATGDVFRNKVQHWFDAIRKF